MRKRRLRPSHARAAVFGLWLTGCILTAGVAHAADQISIEERVSLQTMMSQYIDQHTIGDAFWHIDPHTGDILKLYPATQHPMIVRMNKVVVLCADLRTADGKVVNADFYAIKDNGQYVIFQAEIGNREPLQALLMKGAASLLE